MAAVLKKQILKTKFACGDIMTFSEMLNIPYNRKNQWVMELSVDISHDDVSPPVTLHLMDNISNTMHLMDKTSKKIHELKYGNFDFIGAW